jgi:hypothetical protein
MPSFYEKFDYVFPEIAKETIEDEAHTIPTSTPHEIVLRHIPKEDDPSTVEIDGFTEVDEEPGPGEFRVLYGIPGFGRIEFNEDDGGTSITVDYAAAGTIIWAETYDGGNRQGVNHMQEVIEEHIDDTDNPHEVSLEQARQIGDTLEGDLIIHDGDVDRRIEVRRDRNGVEHVIRMRIIDNGNARIEHIIDGTISARFIEIDDDGVWRIPGDLSIGGNVEYETSGEGPIVTTPDGNTQYRIRVDDDGNLVTEEVT